MANPIAFIKRPAHLIAALSFGVAALLPALIVGTSSAGQVQDRSIQLANSASGATGVSYAIQFELETDHTAASLEGIVVDICNGVTSPLIGTACTAPTGFDWGTPTVTSAVLDYGGNDTDISSWTFGTLNSGRTLTITDATGDNTDVGAGSIIRIVLSGVDNPSDVDGGGANDVGTFYGRIITFDDDTQVASYDPTAGETTTGYVDMGGVALSTTNDLTVSARVQESITFCIYTSGSLGGTSDCTTGTGSAIDIPDATTPLSSSSVQTANAYYNLASNALSGVNVRMWSNNGNDGVLTSGSNTITAFGPVDDTACTADSVTTTVEQFGMRLDLTNAATSSAAATYACASGNHGWDADGAGDDTTTVGSAYGDSVATTSGPHDNEETVMEFAAKSALTTEAGVYTTDLNFIATGTY